MKFTNDLALGQDMTITFHRTCRVPRMGDRINELPASLGHFPIYRVSDFKGNVPSDWNTEGHFMPMFPHEAMWMSFSQKSPVALMVGAGMVNAVTGERLTATLTEQNYLVCPPQPWLDGFKPTSGEKVFQFVAAQLGSGETAEEQILGSSEFGGLQFGLFKSKIALISSSVGFVLAGASAPTMPRIANSIHYRLKSTSFSSLSTSASVGSMAFNAGSDARAMGLGAGGAIRQKIYPDPYLLGREISEVWHTEPSEKGYVYICHANDFKSITGQDAPASPITYRDYQTYGLPWFGLPDGSWGDVDGGQAIDTLKPVSGDPHPTDADALTINPTTTDLWK